MKEPEGGALLQRIEAALKRGEAAAERLSRTHGGLRAVAQDTLAGLEKLIEGEKKRSNG
ncbi:hypothetical protein [Sandaracinobacteroides hominis]|uniref:hypothetical protein n=1 Tax=Sandaracinobacteroides hominis TaxID=2780086 RepID=UPI0018F56567|nr:hypothetical protein [Sandaracinobacteroides hominis]